jgi:uncharacterized protein YceK
MKKTVLLFAVAAVLVGCSTVVPVKGFTSNKSTWIGSFDTSKSFQMSDGKVACSGKGKSKWSNFTVVIPFTCDDGRTGQLTETKALSGRATAEFSDGTVGEFYWGTALS